MAERGEFCDDFIACDEQRDSRGSLELHAFARCILDGGDDRLECGAVAEGGERFGEIVEREDLVLQGARTLESGEQFIRLRKRLGAEDKVFVLFLRDADERVGLERLLHIFPPFLECGFCENIRHELLGDLLLRGASAEAGEDDANDCRRVGLREFFHAVHVAEFLCADVICIKNHERFRSVLELHRVALLGFEIYDGLAEQKVVRSDGAVAPALVLHDGAGFQFRQSLTGLGCEFACCDCLLDVVGHNWGAESRDARGGGQGISFENVKRAAKSPAIADRARWLEMGLSAYFCLLSM